MVEVVTASGLIMVASATLHFPERSGNGLNYYTGNQYHHHIDLLVSFGENGVLACTKIALFSSVLHIQHNITAFSKI